MARVEKLNAAIDGIRQRLEGSAATAAAEEAGAAASSCPEEIGPTSRNGSIFAKGDTCLAPRVFDRRRALAVVEAVDAAKDTCLVTWVHPRHKREIVCRYWKKDKNCKFSNRGCSFSHGVEVPLVDLLPSDYKGHKNDKRGGDWQRHTPANLEQASSREPRAVPETDDTAPPGLGGSTSGAESWLATLGAGSRVLARYYDRVWYDAAAERPVVDGFLAVRFTGFEDEGSVSLPADLSYLAPPDDEVDDGAGRRGGGGSQASSGGDDKESEIKDAWADDALLGDDDDGGDHFFQERVLGGRREDGGASSVGAGKGVEAGLGLLTDAYVFGDWEQHTKGFGSRMLSQMGYRRGEGLGKEKQGISRPVPIRVLPERRALDHLRADDGRKPRAQPGPRKHKSKAKSSSSAGNEDDREPQKAMFDFLNVTIHASAREKGASAIGSRRASSSGPTRSSLAGRSRLIFDGSSLASRVRGGKAQSDEGVDKGAGKGGGGPDGLAKIAANMTRSELRLHLVGAREAETALAAKATRLKETIARNSEREPRIAAAAKRKLEEVKVQEQEVRASMNQAERMLGNRKSKGSGGKGGLFSF